MLRWKRAVEWHVLCWRLMSAPKVMLWWHCEFVLPHYFVQELMYLQPRVWQGLWHKVFFWRIPGLENRAGHWELACLWWNACWCVVFPTTGSSHFDDCSTDQKAEVVEVQTLTRKPLLDLKQTEGGGYALPKDRPTALQEKKMLVRSLVGLTYRKQRTGISF